METKIKIERRRQPRPPWLESFPSESLLPRIHERMGQMGEAWEPHPAEQQREDA